MRFIYSRILVLVPRPMSTYPYVVLIVIPYGLEYGIVGYETSPLDFGRIALVPDNWP